MNTRLLRLSALIALAYGFSIPAAYAQAVSPTTPDAANTAANTATTPDVTLDPVVVNERLDRARNSISVDTGSSVYHFSPKDIAALPQGDNTSFNQFLLQAPGVAEDSFGQVHIRGDHDNVQYRLNGIMLPESITGFGQTLDTRFVDSMNLITGALPAQYGDRTAGIIDIHTKTGQVNNGGDIGVEIGSNNTRQVSGDVSGSHNGFSYYLNGSFDANNLGIESPTGASSTLHDHTTQNKAFGYFSYLIDPDTRLSLILANADSRFQIPDTPGKPTQYSYTGVLDSDYPSANLNENQSETTRYGILALQGVIGDKIDYQLAAFSRYTQVMFTPDTIGDLLYTGVASNVVRSGLANGLQADAGYRLNDTHTLRAGLAYTRETLNNSNDSQTFAADPTGVQTVFTPESIDEQDQKVTNQVGIYLQDEWKLSDKLTANYGVRFDWINAYVTASQLSPRFGLVYQISPRTTLHTGYARYFTPPPNELIPGSTVTAFNNTTNQSLSSTNDPVQPERSNYYDLGITQRLTENLTLGLDGYYKQVKDMLDEGQFNSALVYTPYNYAQGKVYGAELTLNYRKDDLGAYFNLARATSIGKDIISSQYNFLTTSLNYIANNWVYADHSQTITASAGTSYQWRGTLYSADALLGSGLRSGTDNTSHLPTYTEFNASVSHTFNDSFAGKVNVRLTVLNLLDRVYEIRDGSGIGVGQPQYGQRRGMYLAMTKSF